MIDKKLLNKAIKLWGVEAQIWMAIEEMSELTSTLCQKWRGRDSDVIQEIADVKIMMAQIELIFGEEAVRHATEQKMERLKARLDNAEAKEKSNSQGS